MRSGFAIVVGVVAALGAPGLARAQPGEPAPPPEVPPEVPPDAPVVTQPTVTLPTVDELARRIDEQDERLRDQETRLREAEKQKAITDSTKDIVDDLLPLRRYITVFVDVGAFAVAGDGSGIRSDFLHVHYPEYRDTVAGQWVFMGDPFSTAINALGEPADTADSREVLTDTVNSGGRAAFLVNSVGLAIGKDVGHGVSISSLVQFLPRPGPDVVDLSFAHVDYRPSENLDLVLQAGKIDSVLGVEYRAQDAPRRLGVTPSLICRYTCGRPTGISARLVHGRLSTSTALVNGDNFDERFEPESELKSNRLPTIAGHIQWMLPLGQGLELGASGAFGPQDGQPRRSTLQWHYGFDARLRDLAGWDITAEYVQGKQQGRSGMAGVECDLAPCLTYKGAYVVADHRLKPWITPYVRVDWRDAVHQRGADFVYESHTLRSTVGVHLEMTSRIVGKVEYTWNHELGVPSFPHDVVTSSVVVSTD
jgi:hypothetical protein